MQWQITLAIFAKPVAEKQTAATYYYHLTTLLLAS
jgi:hypothetical protein